MFGVVSLTMGNSHFPAGDRLARDVEFVCELFLRHAGAFAASGDFGSYDHTEDLLLLGSFYTKTVGKATMSTWNFRNFELRRAIFGEFCRLFWGEALFCFVFRVQIADVAGDVFVVIGIGVAVFCSEIFSGISKEFVAGEKRPPCVFHRIRAIRGKKRLPLLCGEILIDEFIVFADAEREAVCAADLPREHAKKFIAHHRKQVNGE